MHDAVLGLVDDADVVVKAAAVADFRPPTAATSKLKKADGVPTIELTATPTSSPSSARAAGGTRPPLLVGFAAETDDVEANGRAKLARKGADLLVVNDVSADAGFEVDTNRSSSSARDGSRDRGPAVHQGRGRRPHPRRGRRRLPPLPGRARALVRRPTPRRSRVRGSGTRIVAPVRVGSALRTDPAPPPPVRSPRVPPHPVHLGVRHRGHPDKMADQISDAILDAILTEDPDGRVACETLVTTGQVMVAGEISTTTYVDIPRGARHDPVDRLRLARRRLRRQHLRGVGRHRRAVARHRPGRRHRLRVRGGRGRDPYASRAPATRG
jgi:hypothetical protein